MEGKRRRVDTEYSYAAQPSTSRTQAKAAASRTQDSSTHRVNSKDTPTVPLLSLATLPPASLQRYLSRYGLLEAQGSLSYHHAVFPVPSLPATLHPPLVGRTLAGRRLSRPSEVPPFVPSSSTAAAVSGEAGVDGAVAPGAEGAVAGEGGMTAATIRRQKKRTWQEPKTNEFANLSAWDHPQVVVDRLAARAKVHWDKRDSVKEGETLTNFIFALRMRAHTLRATPPG